MGEAIIGAILNSNLLPASMVYISDADTSRRAYLAEKFQVIDLDSNIDLFETCQIVFLAVKPQQMPVILDELSNQKNFTVPERKLIISIAAGYPIRKLESKLYSTLDEKEIQNLPIIRVMPNTPALVLSAVSGMSPNRFATKGDIISTQTLFEAIGSVLRFDEGQLDAVTALSGSGPAYVFYLVESLINAGTQVGLDPNAAITLATKTLSGSVKLLETSGESPKELRHKVTSPGGTTEAAIEVFETRGFKDTIIEAIAAAARRARELSE
jgi:pyrroline-5-carboxylate reductase